MTPATQTQVPPTLLTAEEFIERYAHQHVELVDGVVVETPMPTLRHGQVCSKANRLLGNFVEEHNLGHVMSNDTFVRTRRDPARVRGPDVLYVSYGRLPPGPAPDRLTDLVPELTVEVRSASNDWSDIFTKVGEYLRVGVTAVLVLDPDTATASVYRKDEFQQIFGNGDELTLPDVLPGFAVPVAKFFE